jgi:hypothetical protein
MTLLDIKDRIQKGEIKQDVFVWRDGLEDWIPIRKTPELAPLFERKKKKKPRKSPRATQRKPTKTNNKIIKLRQSKKPDRDKTAEPVVLEKQAEAVARVEVFSETAPSQSGIKLVADFDIADEFFCDGEDLENNSELLPPPFPTKQAQLHLVQEEIMDPEEADKLAKVIARHAGVASHGRRAGLGLLMTFLFVGLMTGMVALAFIEGWFGEFGFATNSNTGTEVKQTALPNIPDRLSDKEAKRIQDSLWKTDTKPKKTAPDSLSVLASIPRKMSAQEKDLMEFYEKQTNGKREIAPRLPSSLADSKIASFNMPKNADLHFLAPTSAKVEASVPESRGGYGSHKLSEAQVRLVIKKHNRQVRKCLERQLKRDPDISGKLIVIAKVTPSGKVTRVRIEPAKFHGTYLQDCLIAEVRRWSFPSFQGEAYELSFPYAMSARESY